MIDPLAGSRLKQRRALEHLKGLKEEIERFYKTEPYTVGDILHNLRSMLDHIVWQLTIANGHTPPSFPLPKGSDWRRIQFPIYLDKNDFSSMRSNPRADYLWGVASHASPHSRVSGDGLRVSPAWGPTYRRALLARVRSLGRQGRSCAFHVCSAPEASNASGSHSDQDCF